MKLPKHFWKGFYIGVALVWVFNISMCTYRKWFIKPKTVTVKFQNINELLKKNPDDPDLLQTKAELEMWAIKLRPMIESNIRAYEKEKINENDRP